MVVIILFWISVFLIIYGFAGYVVLLGLLCLFKHNVSKQNSMLSKDEDLPVLTLLISVYNEEMVIEEKLRNALSLDYPKDKLEILVISDGTTDATEDKVKAFADKGVQLLKQEPRGGKTAALNMAVPMARGEIIVFSDANSMYEKGSLQRLAMHFSQRDIGFVTGRTKYISCSGLTTAGTTERMYTRMELLIKRMECQVSSCVGADGAIFAIRKKLYLPLKAYDINDFVIPLNIIEQGYRGILEEKAVCLEESANGISGEFRRQVRITCRTIRAIFNNKNLLNPFKFPFFSFALFSHKLIKYMVPFFLMIAFLTNMAIVATSSGYQILFAAQIIFYLFFISGYLQRNKEDGFKLSRLVYAFVVVSAAMFIGWIKYFSGETYTTWQSERS